MVFPVYVGYPHFPLSAIPLHLGFYSVITVIAEMESQ